VATGTTEDVAMVKERCTGHFLKKFFPQTGMAVGKNRKLK
jgi:hypothetical protein